MAVGLAGFPVFTARAAPVESTILTVTDEVLPPSASGRSGVSTTPVELETPVDLSTREDPRRILFQSAYPALDFEEVKAFLFKPESRHWIGSEAEAIEWYRLGSLDAAAPPLPGWGRSYGRHASWQPAVPAQLGEGSPYLNRAQAVWATDRPENEAARGEFLFRSQLQIDADRSIASAHLHLAINAEAVEVLLNDRPVLTGESEGARPWVADVSRLIEPGNNILAFHLRNRGIPVNAGPSLAFSLELVFVDQARALSSPAFDQAILNTRQGDRIRGRVLTFNPVSILLQTPYGRYGADWDRVESVLFPQGWYEPPPEKSPPLRRLIRFFGFEEISREDAAPSETPMGVPVSPSKALSVGGVLLRDGRSITEELVGVENGQLMLRRRDSRESLNVPRTSVAAIYPPFPDRLRLERPSPAFASLDCRLKTTDGEVFSGILRQIDSRQIILEHPGDGILAFPSGRVVWIWFPMHREINSSLGGETSKIGTPGAKTGTSVAILAMPSSTRPAEDETLELHQDLQQAAFLAGLGCDYPTPESMVDPARLHVRNYPLVAIADSGGDYPDTAFEPGDIRRALLEYVESGGTLLIYSRGGALQHPQSLRPADAEAGRDDASPLLHALDLKLLRPGAEGQAGRRAFDRPPNLPVTLTMKRFAPMPRGLRSLPPRVDAPSLAAAPFYPFISETGESEGFYQLVDDAGVAYGPALLAVRRGEGRILMVDHFLWRASVEGRPFHQVILPQLIRWAFQIQI